MAITQALIPVGGLGTRLLPVTRAQPKEMLPIVDKPVVQYVVEELVRAGISRVLFITGRRKRAIEDHFDADPELHTEPLIAPHTGFQIVYTRQARPAGLGDALRYGEAFAAGGNVVVANGDAIIQTPSTVSRGIVPRLIDTAEQTGAAAVLAVMDVPEELAGRYGIVIPGRSLGERTIEIAEVVEKPDPATVASRLAVMGRYVLGPAAFAALRDTPPDAGGEVQLADALRAMIAQGEQVLAVRLAPGERRHDIGGLDTYCATFLEYALADPRFGPQLRAHARRLLESGG